jgi:hypothetical protein
MNRLTGRGVLEDPTLSRQLTHGGKFVSLGNRPRSAFQKHIFLLLVVISMSRGSVVGIATGYGLDVREVGIRVPVGYKIVTSPYRPDLSVVHPTSYPMCTEGSFFGGKSGRGVKLTIHLQPVPESRKHGSLHPLPHTFHGEVLN